LAEAIDAAERGAQVVRDRVAERLQLLVRGPQLRGLLAEILVEPRDLLLVALALADLRLETLDGALEFGRPRRDALLQLDVQGMERILRCPALGDVDPRADHIPHLTLLEERTVGPGDEAAFAASTPPVVLVPARKLPCLEGIEDPMHPLRLLRQQEEIPEEAAFNLREGVAGDLFAGPVEADDPPFPIQDDDQRPHDVEDGGDEIALLLQRALRLGTLLDLGP
jgi:hypothetical protein